MENIGNIIFMIVIYSVVALGLILAVVYVPYHMIKNRRNRANIESRLKQLGFTPSPEHEEYLIKMVKYVCNKSAIMFSIMEPRLCQIDDKSIYEFGLNESKNRNHDYWKVALLIPFKPATKNYVSLIKGNAIDKSTMSELDATALSKIQQGFEIGVESFRIYQEHAVVTIDVQSWLDDMEDAFEYIKEVSAID